MIATHTEAPEVVRLRETIAAIRALPERDYITTRNAVAREVIRERLHFYTMDQSEARKRAARAARFDRRCWRRMRAGLYPVRLLYADGRES